MPGPGTYQWGLRGSICCTAKHPLLELVWWTNRGEVQMLDHILVPLDGSALAEEAIPHGVALASAFNSKLTLLRVVEQSDSSRSIDPLDWHIEKTQADSYLDNIAARLREDQVNVEKVLLEGRAANLIIEFAQTHNVDLIIR